MNLLNNEVTGNSQIDRITPDLIRRFHQLIGQNLGEHLAAEPGRIRTNDVSVASYRCPDHRDVRVLVKKLRDWLANDFGFARGSKKQDFFDAVVETIVTHVYIEWIHPFGDGNGRTGRLIEFYILLRAGNPDIFSHILSKHYNLTRHEYYRQLENAGKRGDLSEFIAYAIQGFRDGLLETLEPIQKSVFMTCWRSYIYDQFAAEKIGHRAVFKRRRRLILNLPFDQEYNLKELVLITPKVARDYACVGEATAKRIVDYLV